MAFHVTENQRHAPDLGNQVRLPDPAEERGEAESRTAPRAALGMGPNPRPSVPPLPRNADALSLWPPTERRVAAQSKKDNGQNPGGSGAVLGTEAATLAEEEVGGDLRGLPVRRLPSAILPKPPLRGGNAGTEKERTRPRPHG